MATPSDLLVTDLASGADALGLAALEEQVRDQLEVLSYPATPWTLPEDADDRFDVVIVGAGQTGLTVAAKLKREGVARVLVLDREPEGSEGPWTTWARMRTLRTQKELHGPDAGIPAATFRSWFVAQFGRDAWDHLGLIPKEQWKAYLRWVRRIFDLDVRNAAEVVDLVSDGTTAVLTVETDGRRDVLRSRAVVVATGYDGYGGPVVPGFMGALPRDRWMHSSEVADLRRFAGRRVGVVGAGASAFDNAAAALEAGAERVVQFVRRSRLATLNIMRSWETRGAYRHFAHLRDDQKLAFVRQFLTHPAPPPDHSVARCEAFTNYELRLGAPVTAVEAAESGVRVTAGGAVEDVDFLILATGFQINLSALPWLGSIRDDIALWGDRTDVTLDASSTVDRAVAQFPVLDAGMRLVGRTVEATQRLRNIHLFGAAGMASVGPQCAGINTLPVGSDTLVAAVTQDLFVGQSDHVIDNFLAQTDAH